MTPAITSEIALLLKAASRPGSETIEQGKAVGDAHQHVAEAEEREIPGEDRMVLPEAGEEAALGAQCLGQGLHAGIFGKGAAFGPEFCQDAPRALLEASDQPPRGGLRKMKRSRLRSRVFSLGWSSQPMKRRLAGAFQASAFQCRSST